MFKKTLKVNLKVLTIICMLYYYIPCYGFVLKWLRTPVAIVFAVLMTFSLVIMARSLKSENIDNSESFFRLRGGVDFINCSYFPADRISCRVVWIRSSNRRLAKT